MATGRTYSGREFSVILCIAIFFAFITISKFGLRWEKRTFFMNEYSPKEYIHILFLNQNQKYCRGL